MSFDSTDRFRLPAARLATVSLGMLGDWGGSMLLRGMGDIVPGETCPCGGPGGTMLLLLFLVSMLSGLLNESVMELMVLCSPDIGLMERDMGKPPAWLGGIWVRGDFGSIMPPGDRATPPE